MKWKGLFSLAGAAMFTVACADGRDADSAAGRAGEPASVGTTGAAAADERGAADVQQFVSQAAMAGNAEVQLGQLASERAVNREVKQFAEMMVTDHTASGAELKRVVSPHNLSVPATIDSKHQELIAKLRGTTGAEFDREYMAAMVEGHEAVKDLVEGRSRRADNRNANGTAATGASADHNQQLEIAVNEWAAKTLPAVERHLERAKELEARVADSRTSSRR